MLLNNFFATLGFLVVSLYSVIGSVFSAVVNPLIGIAADYSLKAAFLLCNIMCIIALLLLKVFYKEKSKNLKTIKINNN